jgi:hypothetical protein
MVWWSRTHRGRRLKRYSVISIMLRYVAALSHNALTLLRSVIASIIYRFGHFYAIIASYSYCSKLRGQRYCFYSLSLSVIIYLLFNFSSSLDLKNKILKFLFYFK